MSTVTTATTITSREFHVVARPDGEPRPDHFELVETHLHPPADGDAAAQEWLRDGWLHFRETFVDGLERMPDALLGLYRGDNLGKRVVRVED
jgi:NADPH-dependent curcumin reductase CurA